MGVAGETEGKDSRSDRADFGPSPGAAGQSFSDFGPADSGFGPADSAFGAGDAQFGPGDDDSQALWRPEPAPENPELTWRPASETPPEPPATVPPPPPQYRAPDSTFPEMSISQQRPAPADDSRTVRHSVAPEENLTVRHPVDDRTVRHSQPDRNQPEAGPAAGRQADDLDTWWNRPTSSGGMPASPKTVGSAGADKDPAGLSWADDPIARRLTPQSVTEALARPQRRKRSNGRLIAIGGVVVTAAVVIGSIVLLTSGGEPGTPAPPDTTSAALSCPASQDGKVTVGNGAGDTDSGPGAILGFQHAFYVDRNGQKAREFVAPDAENISSAEVIQAAIDEQIPKGTTHCMRITERATDTFDVDLTEHRPDGTTTVYRQTVTTAQRDGKTQLFSIGQR
ncbi:hypothetical protein B0T36_13920 [Nocardia donostiensis]|nr:hypothetical protein B0T36_13920 [Nocardia donostiensis]